MKVRNTILYLALSSVVLMNMAYGMDLEIKGKETAISSYRIGFEELHDKGLKGTSSSGITIIEPNMKFNPEHPTFKGNTNITLKDVGRSECPDHFQDLSTFRYKDDFSLLLDFWYTEYHNQGIASILIGSPDHENNFDGGIVPCAKLNLISLSHVNTSGGDYLIENPMFYAGTALYSFRQSMINKYNLKESQDFPESKKVDDSIYDALKIAFESATRVISGSFNLQSPCDYKNRYLLSQDYLNFLAEGLVKNDQVMIFSAGNFENDITQRIQKSHEIYDIILDYKNTGNCHGYKKEDFERTFFPTTEMDLKAIKLSQQNYFVQYAAHPIIKERFLLVTNIALEKENIHRKSGQKIKFCNGREYSVGLHNTSCYPGDDSALQQITVSAFGNQIVNADKMNSFGVSNGTSVAVPMVAGLLTLIDEHYINKGKKLSGPELIRIIKETCIGDRSLSQYYGNGIIDPLGFLNITKSSHSSSVS